MKKVFNFFTLLCFLGNCFCETYAQTPWSKLYDFCPDTGVRTSNNVAQYADDNGFVVAGHTYTPGVSNKHAYIASFDYNGNLINQQSLYFPGTRNMLSDFIGDEYINCLTKTSNNTYLLVGTEENADVHPPYKYHQPYFYFFNKNCDSLKFVKKLDSNFSKHPLCVIVDNQNNIVVSGMAFNPQIAHAWLAKYDANGNLLWNKFLHSKPNMNITGKKVIVSNDGLAYFIAGQSYNPTLNAADVFLTKTDLDGNIIWSKFLPRPFLSDNDIDIIPLSDGNYGFISTTQDADGWPLPTKVYYGKFDGNGNLTWAKTFEKGAELNYGQQILEAENGDLLLYYTSFFNGRDQNIVVRTLKNGDIKWYREYRHIDTNFFVQQIQAMSYTKDKKVLLSGYFYNYVNTQGYFDSIGTWSWFMMTDTFGCMVPGCQSIDTMWHTGIPATASNADLKISIYPNPAQETLFIQTGAAGGEHEACLLDMNGRKLLTKSLYPDSKAAVDIQTLPPGLYMLEIWEDGRRVQVYKVEHY